MSDFVLDFAAGLAADVRRIEVEKHGKALTPNEAQTLKAYHGLRLMAPYLFPPEPEIEAEGEDL